MSRKSSVFLFHVVCLKSSYFSFKKLKSSSFLNEKLPDSVRKADKRELLTRHFLFILFKYVKFSAF